MILKGFQNLLVPRVNNILDLTRVYVYVENIGNIFIESMDIYST